MSFRLHPAFDASQIYYKFFLSVSTNVERELFLVVAEMIPKLKTRQSGKAPSAVSYTHLTLPTIYSV